MKLYIYNNGLWHLCGKRRKIDSLFYKKEDYYYCPLCDCKIPTFLAFAFTQYGKGGQPPGEFVSLAINGNNIDYTLDEFKNLNYIEFEI